MIRKILEQELDKIKNSETEKNSTEDDDDKGEELNIDIEQNVMDTSYQKDLMEQSTQSAQVKTVMVRITARQTLSESHDHITVHQVDHTHSSGHTTFPIRFIHCHQSWQQ